MDTTTLFDSPAQRPPMPASGQWHQNWFSNMRPFQKPLVDEHGIVYVTPEHYFQAMKSEDVEVRRLIASLGRYDQSGREKFNSNVRGHGAKSIWKLVGEDGILRISREKALKIGVPPKLLGKEPMFVMHMPKRDEAQWIAMRKDVMRTAIEHKFQPGTLDFNRLMLTGREELVEWTNWGDVFWGRNISDGAGANELGTMLMERREWGRENGYTVHALAEKFRALDPKACGVASVEQYRSKHFVTMVGSRETTPDEEAFLFWSAYTLVAAGISLDPLECKVTIRSGGAEGADKAAENGAKTAIEDVIAHLPEAQRNAARAKLLGDALEISHPYDRPSKGSADPGNYVQRSKAYKDLEHALVKELTDNYDRMSEPARALQARDIEQFLGKDGQTPSDATIFCSTEEAGYVNGGTRFCVYTTRMAPLFGYEARPDYNIRQVREKTRAAVVEMANRYRQERGLAALPADYSPTHAEYMRVRNAAVATQEEDKAGDLAAQASAKKLIAQMRVHHVENHIKGTFVKVEETALEMKPFARDGTVVILCDDQGRYALIDERKTTITVERNDNQGRKPSNELPFDCDVVRLQRAAGGQVIVEARNTARVIIPSEEAVAAQMTARMADAHQEPLEANTSQGRSR